MRAWMGEDTDRTPSAWPLAATWATSHAVQGEPSDEPSVPAGRGQHDNLMYAVGDR